MCSILITNIQKEKTIKISLFWNTFPVFSFFDSIDQWWNRMWAILSRWVNLKKSLFQSSLPLKKSNLASTELKSSTPSCLSTSNVPQIFQSRTPMQSVQSIKKQTWITDCKRKQKTALANWKTRMQTCRCKTQSKRNCLWRWIDSKMHSATWIWLFFKSKISLSATKSSKVKTITQLNNSSIWSSL